MTNTNVKSHDKKRLASLLLKTPPEVEVQRMAPGLLHIIPMVRI